MGLHLGIRLTFNPGTNSFVIQANRGVYASRGSAANFSSTVRIPVAYAITAARGTYGYASGATTFAYIQPGITPSAPQKVWPGVVNSIRVAMTVWPPLDGTNPPAFNFYRTDMPLGPGVPLNGATTPVPLRKADGGSNTIPYSFFTDTSPASGTSYNYFARATSSATPPYVESADSPQLSVITLPATGNTPPAPVIDPATYIPAYVLPVGGTLWTATQNSAAANTGSAGAGTGTKNATGCSLQYALNNAGVNDIIAVSILKFTSNTGTNAFTVPATSAGGFWVVSVQDQLYNPTTGTLPYYSYWDGAWYTKFTAASAPLAGATSLTLDKIFL